MTLALSSQEGTSTTFTPMTYTIFQCCEMPKTGNPENGNNVMHERPEANDIISYDNLIGATFLLDPLKSPDNVATKATVIRRKTDHLGNPLGKAHANPLLDTWEYEVEL
jgi:hypothetical protein